MSDLVRAVVGFGGNLGHTVGYFGDALMLLQPLVRVVAHSRLYESAPWGRIAQRRFLNAAVLIECEPNPIRVMARLLEVERRVGRVRRSRWGPRVLDLDLLWMSSVRTHSRLIRVPHPRLLERAFALRPLLDVAPDATEPSTGRPYTKYLPWLQGQQIVILSNAPKPWASRLPDASGPQLSGSNDPHARTD